MFVFDGFMRIVCIAFKIIFSMKKGYVYVWKRVSFAGMLFNVIINVIIFLVLKGLKEYFQICKYTFLA